MKWERDNSIRLLCDKLWNNTAGLVESEASKGLQPVVLKHAGGTAVQPKSGGNEPGTSEAVAGSRETPTSRLSISLPAMPVPQCTQYGE